MVRRKRVDSGAALVAAVPLAPNPPLPLLEDLELRQGVCLALRLRWASVQQRRWGEAQREVEFVTPLRCRRKGKRWSSCELN